MQTTQFLFLNTKNRELSETEFLHREFGFLINNVDDNGLKISSNGICIIACTNPRQWLDQLNNSSLNIFFILLGNETYEIPLFEFFNDYVSVKHIFLFNCPRKNKLFHILGHITLAIENPALFFSRKYWRLWKNAYDFARRTRRVEILKPHSIFPLGYTNRFVAEISSLDVLRFPTSKSLIELALEFDVSQKQQEITFYGQVGSWYRRLVVEQFQKEFNMDCHLYEVWGGAMANVGVTKSAYVKTLQISQFVLCPPGNITNETFRYLESLILGCIPLIPANTVQDHHTNNYLSERVFSRWTNRSYKSLYKKFLNLDSSTLRALHREEVHQRLKQIRELRTIFESGTTEIKLSN